MLPAYQHFKNKASSGRSQLLGNLTQNQKNQGSYLMPSISAELIQ